MTAVTETRAAYTGLGQTLNRQAKDSRDKFTVRFLPVKNKVRWINPEINAPFDLKTGKPCPLGLFAYYGAGNFAYGSEGFAATGKPVIELESSPDHCRTALAGRVVCSDRQGRLYRDIDVKGIGYINYKLSDEQNLPVVAEPGKPSRGGHLGLLDYEDAFKEAGLCEEFTAFGIRTNRVIAILDLEELIVRGENLSIKEAKKRHVMGSNFHPVIAVRAFGTHLRVRDLGADITADTALDDAMKLAGYELGCRFDDKLSYFLWFAETFGRNMGLLHREGYYHRYLTGHNVTLDCRILDFDAVSRENSYLIEDRQFSVITVRNLCRTYIDDSTTGRILSAFNSSYQNTLNGPFRG